MYRLISDAQTHDGNPTWNDRRHSGGIRQPDRRRTQHVQTSSHQGGGIEEGWRSWLRSFWHCIQRQVTTVFVQLCTDCIRWCIRFRPSTDVSTYITFRSVDSRH